MKRNTISNPIIFFGAPRSGTTIISEIIFSHEDLAWPSNYSDKFYKYTWVNVFRRIFQNKLWYFTGNKIQLHKGVWFNKALFKPAESYKMWDYLVGGSDKFSRGFQDYKASESRKKFIRQYFFNLISFQGKDRLALKVTGPSRLTFLQSIFPDAYFIRVKRNSTSSISSLIKVPFWKDKGKNKLWWRGKYTKEEQDLVELNSKDSIFVTAFQYFKIMKECEIEKSKLDINLLEVDYEDFISDPHKLIRSIFDFVKLNPDRRVMEYVERNPIINRNKKATDYFDLETLRRLEMIFKGQYKEAVHK